MTTELSKHITPVSSFIDEAFDIRRINDLHLVLQLGQEGLLAAVLDKQKNKYIALESFVFQSVYNFDLLADLAGTILTDSKIMGHRYRSVSCSLVHPVATLVPLPLYEEDRKKSFLTFNAPLQGDELVLADELPNLAAKNVFALPLSLKEQLEKHYSRISYHHFSSGLIEGLLAQTRNQSKKQLFVHIGNGHFEVIVIEGRKLLLYNSFNHHTPEDFIYYLLFVCETLHLNPEQIETIVLGEIEKASAIYAILLKYVKHVQFGARMDSADLSYQLQTFPRHFYFGLFNSYLA